MVRIKKNKKKTIVNGKTVTVTIELKDYRNKDFPSVPIWFVSIETPGGIWQETFVREKQIRTFERGMKAFAGTFDMSEVEFPEIPKPDFE